MSTGRQVSTLTRRSWLGRAGVLACGTLAGLPWARSVQSQPPAFRSVQDARQWVPDGSWEVHEGPVAVAANTSEADARWAAGEIAKAQAQTTKLVARFAPGQSRAPLPADSLQVAIDARPRRGRAAVATTINVVGIQTQVQLDVSSGQPALKDQLGRLREAAAFAVLHAMELDAALPPAVVLGLAHHVGQQIPPAASDQAEQASPLLTLLGGEQWQWQRAAPGQLRQPGLLAAAAQQTSFLIAGNDAQHAPDTLAALADACGRRVQRTEGADAGTGLATRQSLARLQSRLGEIAALDQATVDEWLKDPLVGQPEFTPDEKLPADVIGEQRDMLVVLKLQRRIGAAESRTGKVKITTFDRNEGRGVPAAAPAKEPVSVAGLVDRLRDPLKPTLATIDVDGSVLLSTDRERLGELLGRDQRRYSVEKSGEQWVLTTRLADGRMLQGWLAENIERPRRPLAKFAIAEAAPTGDKPPPASEPQKSASRLGVIER